MTEIKSPLLGNKSTKTFEEAFNTCLVQYNGLKQKNDFLQRTSLTDLDNDIIQEVRNSGEFFEVNLSTFRIIFNLLGANSTL